MRTTRVATPALSLYLGFSPFVAASIVHVVALAAGFDAVSGPSKLVLMPALAFAVVVGGLHLDSRAAIGILVAGIALSWLGDGAGTFFQGAPTLPLMLLFFGLAHLCYIWLFTRHLAVRRLPRWALIYGLWWLALLIILWPRLGELSIAVAAYGLVLGATALLSTRCNPIVALGGLFFLASDTILAFRLFASDLMPDWTSPLVMLTYTLGQGLIAAGALISLRQLPAQPATLTGVSAA